MGACKNIPERPETGKGKEGERPVELRQRGKGKWRRRKRKATKWRKRDGMDYNISDGIECVIRKVIGKYQLMSATVNLRDSAGFCERIREWVAEMRREWWQSDWKHWQTSSPTLRHHRRDVTRQIDDLAWRHSIVLGTEKERWWVLVGQCRLLMHCGTMRNVPSKPEGLCQR